MPRVESGFEQERVVRPLLKFHGDLLFTDVDGRMRVAEISEERSRLGPTWPAHSPGPVHCPINDKDYCPAA